MRVPHVIQNPEINENFEAVEEAAFPETAFMAYRSTAFNLTPEGFTNIPLNTLGYGKIGMLGPNGGYVVPQTGLYLVSATIASILPQVERDFLVSVLVGGIERIRGSRIRNTVLNAIWNITLFGFEFLKKGDEVVLASFWSGTPAAPLEIGSAQNRLNMLKIA